VDQSGSASANLYLSGLEEAVAESAIQGRDKSFTLTVTASLDVSTPAGKQKAEQILFTKNVRFDDLMHGNLGKGRLAAEGSPAEEGSPEPIAISLPAGLTDVGARITGDQSGFVTSERIALEPTAGEKPTLIIAVESLPEELAVYAEESPVNLALYNPVVADETATTSSGSHNKGDGTESESGDMLVWEIDPADGKLTPRTKVRSGYGGEGSIGSVSDDGGLGFIVQKGKPEGSEFSGYIRAKDGSMKPLALPEGSDQTTLARDTQTGMLYLLKPQESRLLVKKTAADGSLEEIAQMTTGRDPSMLYLMPSSRLILVANSGDKTVSVFSIGESGTLTLQQTLRIANAPTAIETTAGERFIYVAQEGGGINRFSIDVDNNNQLIFIDTMEAGAELASLNVDSTTKLLIGMPNVAAAKCASAGPCVSKPKIRKWWKKARAKVERFVKVVISVIRVIICPIGGPISSFGCIWGTFTPFTANPHWFRELLRHEVGIKIGNNVSERWNIHLDRAIADWSASSRLNLEKRSGSTNAKHCDFILGRIEVCSADYGDTKWSGLAIPIYFSEHVITGVVLLNDRKFNPLDTSPEESRRILADRQAVMCQELGHTLGLLFHRDENDSNPNLGTCMDYTNYPGGNPTGIDVNGLFGINQAWNPNNEHPDGADMDRLFRHHDHFDGVINIDRYVMDALKFIRIPSVQRLGVLKRSTPDKKKQVYALDLGKKMTMVTHVSWAKSKR
jgi:hypothetical protein